MLRERVQGQPLAVLVLIIGGWIAFRVVAWQPPHWNHAEYVGNDLPLQVAAPEQALRDHGHGNLASGHAEAPGYGIDRGPISPPTAYFPFDPRQPYWGLDKVAALPHRGIGQSAPSPRQTVEPSRFVHIVPGGGHDHHDHHERPEGRAMVAAGHQLMWMAALARMSVPPELAPYVGQSASEAPSPVPMSPGRAQKSGDRWSADSWLLLRQESKQALASGRPIYGGSQAGAVLRYHLAPKSGHRPMAYLRVSQAMGGISQSEAALGAGLRPVPGIPIMVAAEARAFRSGGKTSIRPAALAYTELPPAKLPLGFKGETYLQGGYVGGDFKTAFVDGQLRVDRSLVKAGKQELRLGGGAWGGAQKGAERLDVGPSATAALNLAGVPSRIALDWRFRLKGNAEPKSGPAVTVSAGF